MRKNKEIKEKVTKLNIKMFLILGIICTILVTSNFYYSGVLAEQAINNPVGEEVDIGFGDDEDGDEGGEDGGDVTTPEELTMQTFSNGFSAYNYANDYIASCDSIQIKGSGSMDITTGIPGGYLSQTLYINTVQKNGNYYNYMESLGTDKGFAISALIANTNLFVRDTHTKGTVYSQIITCKESNAMGAEWETTPEVDYTLLLLRNNTKSIIDINKDTTVCSNFRSSSKEYTFNFQVNNTTSLSSSLNNVISQFMVPDRALNITTLSITVVIDKYGRPISMRYEMQGSLVVKGFDANASISITERFGNFNKNINLDPTVFYTNA